MLFLIISIYLILLYFLSKAGLWLFNNYSLSATFLIVDIFIWLMIILIFIIMIVICKRGINSGYKN